jgi:hypothetical protein
MAMCPFCRRGSLRILAASTQEAVITQSLRQGTVRGRRLLRGCHPSPPLCCAGCSWPRPTPRGVGWAPPRPGRRGPACFLGTTQVPGNGGMGARAKARGPYAACGGSVAGRPAWRPRGRWRDWGGQPAARAVAPQSVVLGAHRRAVGTGDDEQRDAHPHSPLEDRRWCAVKTPESLG